jgi:hypothetical protein
MGGEVAEPTGRLTVRLADATGPTRIELVR